METDAGVRQNEDVRANARLQNRSACHHLREKTARRRRLAVVPEPGANARAGQQRSAPRGRRDLGRDGDGLRQVSTDSDDGIRRVMRDGHAGH
jgi:hypothetical protein